MLFMCESKDLKRCLTLLKPAMPVRSTLPILERVKMVTAKDGVRIRATNLEIAMEVEMNAGSWDAIANAA